MCHGLTSPFQRVSACHNLADNSITVEWLEVVIGEGIDARTDKLCDRFMATSRACTYECP
jgi:hypothetical protein